MGFDMGASAGALALVGIYLFTFIPALLLALLPAAVITKPPLPLKIWYGWVVILLVGAASYGTYYKVNDLIKAYSSTPHGTICFSVSNQKNTAWIDLQTSGGQFQRFNSNGLKNSWCSNWTSSHDPMWFRFYSKTELNISGQRASEEDLVTASKPISVTVSPRSKTCIDLKLDHRKTPSSWSAEIVSCKSLNDPVINRFGG